MFLSNFTHLAGPSVLLKLGPLLKIELIAEHGAFFINKEYKLKPENRLLQNHFLTYTVCKMKELLFQKK